METQVKRQSVLRFAVSTLLVAEEGAPKQAAADWKGLLKPAEVIRDPVHRDIELTELELDIIDMPSFQRLHGIKQLGPTFLVYPGAVHTRFEHSLGTLHMAERFMETLTKNANVYSDALEISHRTQVLIRLNALLHDYAHIPMGHIVEDEGKLFDKQWEDPPRKELLLADSNELATMIRESEVLKKAGLTESDVSALWRDLKALLPASDPKGLSTPFAFDVVGNTICADLLDYVHRDIYFTGLNERIGDRFLRYLAVLPLKSPDGPYGSHEVRTRAAERVERFGRVVLMVYSYDRHLRKTSGSRSTISEAIDLLRKRYSLTQKVYYHKTKSAASAMIVEAVARSGKSSLELLRDEQQDRWNTDEDVLQMIDREGPDEARELVRLLRHRRLYRRIYEFGDAVKNGLDEAAAAEIEGRIQSLVRVCQSKTERPLLQKRIEDQAGLRPGQIIIHCPRRMVNPKPALVLVQKTERGDVKPLRDFLDGHERAELEGVTAQYAPLWTLRVFVHPDVFPRTAPPQSEHLQIARACEDHIGFQNGIDTLRGDLPAPQGVELSEGVLRIWEDQTGEQLAPAVRGAILQFAHVSARLRPLTPDVVERELSRLLAEAKRRDRGG